MLGSHLSAGAVGWEAAVGASSIRHGHWHPCTYTGEGGRARCVGEEQLPQLPWLQSEPSGFNMPELAESPRQSWG